MAINKYLILTQRMFEHPIVGPAAKIVFDNGGVVRRVISKEPKKGDEYTPTQSDECRVIISPTDDLSVMSGIPVTRGAPVKEGQIRRILNGRLPQAGNNN
jgi:hypothetical protein